MNKSLIICLLLLAQNLGAQQIDGNVNATVALSTKHQQLSVDLTYHVFNIEDTASVLRFLLTSKAELRSVTGTGVSGYRVDTVSKPVPSVVIFLNRKRKTVRPEIRFQYSVTYDTAKYNRYGFIEMGLDWFWFPVHPKVSDWNFVYQLNVTTDDHLLALYSNGAVQVKSNQTFQVRSIYPDYDINLFFFKDSKVYKAGSDVTIAGDTSRPLLKDSIAKATAAYLQFYTNTFGKTASGVTAVFRPISNDPNGFGYSRKGYFVLPELKTLDAVKQYIAHEIAHFWFIYGERTENAWLTESLAEFSAMLAMKHFYGDSAYQLMIQDKISRLERFKKDGKIIPTIYKNGTKNKNMLSQVALYHKGPLVMDKLMGLLGQDKLVQVMKLTFEKKIKTSEAFIDLIGQVASTDQKAKARDLIMTF